jgi:hypothetical protein
MTCVYLYMQLTSKIVEVIKMYGVLLENHESHLDNK